MSDERKPTHLDLFSGIGGFSLAFEAEGFETIGFAEIDPYASAVLKKRWPHVRNYGDVRNCGGMRADVVTGGFPCQPVSSAGKRGGASDVRWLWPEMFGVIRSVRPRWVLAENVFGLVTYEGGILLDGVFSDLDSEGYTTFPPLIVPACAVDAKHRRDRVWILAYCDLERSNGIRNGGQIIGGNGEIVSDANLRGQSRSRLAKKRKQKGSDAGGNSQTSSDANKSGLERRNGRSLQECADEWTSRPRSPRSEQPTIWQPEPGLGRVADGIPNRTHRLRCIGNSIVPQVAQIFAKAIRQLI